MFREILRTQWKWTSTALMLCAIGAFTIPLLSLQNALPASTVVDPGLLRLSAEYEFLQRIEMWSPLYTALAALCGLLVAVLVWSADHRGKHIYALVLPLPRWRLVLMRFGAGALLLLLPVTALLAGSLLAAATTEIPAGLHAYPLALAVRFGLAAMVAFALFFAISAGTSRAAAMVIAPILALMLVDALLSASGLRLNLVESAATSIFEWPGIMEIFTGRWMLVDV